MTRNIPTSIFKPLCLLIASRNTLESAADPSHPDKTYANCMSRVQTPNTFVARCPFLVRYLALSATGTETGIYVPSNAPKQFYLSKYNKKLTLNYLKL